MSQLSFEPRGDCSDVRPGDTVVRLMAGSVLMRLRVKTVGRDLFECEVPSAPDEEGWRLEWATGVECDPRPEMMSGTRHGRCISLIVRLVEAS